MDTILNMLLILVIAVLINTLLIMLGWSLFMVPVFGMKSLTLLEALGFAILAATFKPTSLNK